MRFTDPLAYTIPAAEAATGLGRTRIYRELADGRLLAVKVGRRTLIIGDSLRAYIASLPTAKFGGTQTKALEG